MNNPLFGQRQVDARVQKGAEQREQEFLKAQEAEKIFSWIQKIKRSTRDIILERVAKQKAKVVIEGDLLRVEDYDSLFYYNQDGQQHRDDGPACYKDPENQAWFQKGLMHRDDGPAWITTQKPNGKPIKQGEKVVRYEWRQYGKIHREDGPAVLEGERQEWWLRGKIHREDGPAVLEGDHQEWWLRGKQYTENDWSLEVMQAEDIWL